MNVHKLSAALHAKKKRKARQKSVQILRLRGLEKPRPSPTSSSSSNQRDDHENTSGAVDEGRPSSSCVELVHGHVSMMGRQRVMEDVVTVAPPGWLDGEYYFFAVYDGHGGADVAKTCGEKLHKCLEEHIDKAKEEKCISKIDWEKVMGECFSSMDDDFAEAEQDGGRSVGKIMMGSTAVVVLVGKEEIVVANCGDSRAVLCRGGVPVPLSVDHKPDRADEKERIEAIGGKVLNWNGWRVEGVLSTSRSLGDHYLKPYVTSEPEVNVIRRQDCDEFLVIATDGLFDVMCNVIVCEVVKECLNGQIKKHASTETGATEAATILGELAMSRGSTDNISVIVIQLKS